MSDGERGLEADLRELAVVYRARLPHKLAEIDDALALARAGGAAPLASLRSLAHRLRGTAGAYGFRAVSDAAAALDEALGGERAARDAAAIEWSAVDASRARLASAVAAALAAEP